MIWISVLERLPDPYVPVLAFVPSSNYPEVYIAYVTDVGSCGWQVVGGQPDQLLGLIVYAWMPLPAPPIE